MPLHVVTRIKTEDDGNATRLPIKGAPVPRDDATPLNLEGLCAKERMGWVAWNFAQREGRLITLSRICGRN
ncbi:hypothetical protein IG631_16246 [Alternaria alternata]|nr:hypothetical protein IG631_16246 [Alternaria alternata]